MEKDLSAFRPTRIWKRMSAERRLRAAEVFWIDEQSTEQQVEAVAALASHMKFRTKSVVALPLERKAKYLSSLPTITDTIAARALVSYHLEDQRAMMGEFLDALGVTHENGLIEEETVAKPDDERLRAAVAQVAPKYSSEDVSLYLSTLVSQDPETWGALAELPETTAATTTT
jgi:hypothetical protein